MERYKSKRRKKQTSLNKDTNIKSKRRILSEINEISEHYSRKSKDIKNSKEKKDDNQNLEEIEDFNEENWISILTSHIEQVGNDTEEEEERTSSDSCDNNQYLESVKIETDKNKKLTSLIKDDIISENKVKIGAEVNEFKKEIENPKIESLISKTGENIYIDKEITNNINLKDDNTLIFNGKEYKNYSRINKYNKKRKIKKIIYKCINLRKDERIRISSNLPLFCNSTIEYIEPEQNVKSGYFLKIAHKKDVKIC